MTILSTTFSQNTENVIAAMFGDQSAANEVITLLRKYNQAMTDLTARVGTAVGTGNVASERGNGVLMQTLLTFTNMVVSVTDANAYGSQEVYDFPEGRILVLGTTASLQWRVNTDRSTTINDSASLTWALGSAAASNATLTSTMVDLLPKTTKVLSAATTAYNTASTAALAASAQFDGTSSAKKAYLNTGFETGTDIDADGTLGVTGTILLSWIFLGDY